MKLVHSKSFEKYLYKIAKFNKITRRFPVEILYEIFFYLNFWEIGPIALVCRRWYATTHTDIFLEKYISRLPTEYVQNARKKFYDPLRIMRDVSSFIGN